VLPSILQDCFVLLLLQTFTHINLEWSLVYILVGEKVLSRSHVLRFYTGYDPGCTVVGSEDGRLSSLDEVLDEGHDL
jgi:hypothetical protein